MLESIYDLGTRCGLISYGNSDFDRGFFTGLLLVFCCIVLLLILLLILKLVFRRKSLSGVRLTGTDGDTFIAKSAISSAIHALEPDFPAFKVLKVQLHACGRRKAPGVRVTVEFHAAESSFAGAAMQFKQRINRMLKDGLGIDNVKSVTIVLAKITGVPQYRNPGAGDQETAHEDSGTAAGI